MTGLKGDLKARLKRSLAEFDGKSTTLLSEAAVQFRSDPDFPTALLDLAGDPGDAVPAGATWIIKHELESGWRPTLGWTTDLIGGLSAVTAWQAQLHICQSVALLPLNGPFLPALHTWILPLLDHDRPFLRAWALDALCRIAALEDAYESDAVSALDRLSEDGAASVRARVRALMKERSKRRR